MCELCSEGLQFSDLYDKTMEIDHRMTRIGDILKDLGEVRNCIQIHPLKVYQDDCCNSSRHHLSDSTVNDEKILKAEDFLWLRFFFNLSVSKVDDKLDLGMEKSQRGNGPAIKVT